MKEIIGIKVMNTEEIKSNYKFKVGQDIKICCQDIFPRENEDLYPY